MSDNTATVLILAIFAALAAFIAWMALGGVT